MMTKIIISAVLGLITFIGLSLFLYDISIDNQEIELRTTIEAQQKKCETYFDKMWKILQEKAGVTDQYKDAFKEIYPKLMAGRYSGQSDGSLMKWVQESNPTFDVSLYKDLMNSIEAQREGYNNEQNTLIDMKAQHDIFLKKSPSKWFIDNGIKPIDIKIITSSKTDAVYATGKEDDVDLFKKDTTGKK